MVARRKKKYASGEGSQFMTRKAALKKLQLSLKDFRKLCILKGIYPREPKNRKRAQQGSAGVKILYHVKDIQFLLQEPIIWRLRDYKIFYKKVGRARAIRDFESLKKYLDNHPTLKLDHIVKERYPTFLDALHDLDDCLTLLFLFSTFPSIPHVPRDQSMLCQRLTMEFLHALIEAKALRKVFISIKGYYYEAEIKGETINWIVPHHFSFEPQSKMEVDFKLMSIFVEFYTIMLGFVNFKLYHSLNLYYPPKFSDETMTEETKELVDESAFISERIAALNVSISKSPNVDVDEEIEIDSFNNGEDPKKNIETGTEVEKLKMLFSGLKFYLNREVPREPLVFIIRCLGGKVSWDKLLFVGSTFDENDETITHQIVDRPFMDKQYISRYYVQPQWVFDCVNARELLPVNKYFIGEILPPHLSPFVDKDRNQQYIPPEEKLLYDPTLLEELHKNESCETSGQESDNDKSKDVKQIARRNTNKNENVSSASTSTKEKLSVTAGEVSKTVPWEQKVLERQEYKLREKLVKNKHRKLYKSMMEGKKKRAKAVWLLRKKRKIYEEKQKETKSKVQE